MRIIDPREQRRPARPAAYVEPDDDEVRPVSHPTVRRGAALSPRETEILGLKATGLTGKAIAYALGVSEQTVKNHISQSLRKLAVSTTIEAFLSVGWLVPGRSSAMSVADLRRDLTALQDDLATLMHAMAAFRASLPDDSSVAESRPVQIRAHRRRGKLTDEQRHAIEVALRMPRPHLVVDLAVQYGLTAARIYQIKAESRIVA